MKKKYNKPQIMFEDFTMSTNVASCSKGVQQGNATDESCRFYDQYLGEWVFMNESSSGCTAVPPGNHDMLCYHVPTEDERLFAS